MRRAAAMSPVAGGRARGAGRTQYLAVVRKEVLQTLRDRRIMFMLVAAPLIQTVVLGFAVNFEVDRVPTAVADMDRSARSREHLRRLLADETLRRAADAPSAEDAVDLIDQDRAAAAVVIPPRLGADLAAGRPAEVQVVLDGTDPNRANVAAGGAARRRGGWTSGRGCSSTRASRPRPTSSPASWRCCSSSSPPSSPPWAWRASARWGRWSR